MPAGLSSSEARERLAQGGANELPRPAHRNTLQLARDVASEPMFLLLVACGIIYLLLGDRHEALMLLGFVLVVMSITFVQQRRTGQSLNALRDLASPQAWVMRDGQLVKLPGRELVCGDIVLLAEGERVPADLMLVEAAALEVDESMLTGESVPVRKSAPLAADSKVSEDTVCTRMATDLPATDEARLFSGTLITQGTACARVIATGERSTLGRIGTSLKDLDGEPTPIQQETSRVVHYVAIVGLTLAAALAIGYQISTGDWLHSLLAGLTLAMALLPEELPVILTLFLGMGAWRLARERVLTCHLPAIELLGATTVLCVDKTGTLTANRMAVRRLWSATSSHESSLDADCPLPEMLHDVLEFAVLASHRRTFDPMESAIAEFGQRMLANTEHLHTGWTLVDDYPLSRDMLAVSRVWQSPDHRARVIAAKGAPEAIVDLCHLDAGYRAAVTRQAGLLAADGLRVLGVARSSIEAPELPNSQHDFDFEFLGLIALEDPLRADVPQAVADCQAAGIRVVMITGDHPVTAQAIARQAGLANSQTMMTGPQLLALNDQALALQLADAAVFCRVSPAQKLRLVQAFRTRGDVVAVIGDGVNDAPALKAAHIGIAMGIRGTDVAREAADLVLLRDDFASLITAVRFGRRIFANLRKAITFVVAVHVPIVGLSVLPVMLDWPIVLMPVHILFLQLIIDPACSLVFEAEPLEAATMTAMPRPRNARLFDSTVLVRGLWQGSGLLAILLTVYALTRSQTGSDEVARALTFSVLVVSNLGLILANRFWHQTSLSGRVPANAAFTWMSLTILILLGAVLGMPALGKMFAFDTPGAPLMLAGLAASVVSLAWFEAVKWRLDPRRSRRSAMR